MRRRPEPETEFDRLAAKYHVVRTTVEAGGRSFELWRPRSADELISEADFAHDERLPYWADIWPSSVVLAGWMLRQEGGGRALLELGCGLGLVTAAASIAGFRPTATDYYEDALRFARENVTDNGGGEIATRMVDWRAFPDDLGTFDVVVASDVLYEKAYGALVAAAIASTLSPTGFAIVADPGRIAAADFVKQCEVHGMTVEKAERIAYPIGDVTQHIDLYRVGRER